MLQGCPGNIPASFLVPFAVFCARTAQDSGLIASRSQVRAVPRANIIIDCARRYPLDVGTWQYYLLSEDAGAGSCRC